MTNTKTHTQGNNMSANATIAETILQQLGGNKFRVMTGAKNFSYTDNSLRMRIGRNSSNSNYMEITLNGNDLYDITFAKVTKMGEMKSVKEFNDVYVENMKEVFTAHTGMHTSL